MTHLRMATVMASGELAQGHMTSGFRPWDWNTFRKASQDDTDPGETRRDTLAVPRCCFGGPGPTERGLGELLTGVGAVGDDQHP